MIYFSLQKTSYITQLQHQRFELKQNTEMQ